MNVKDFDSFMRQVHGHPPFPWQLQEVEEALERETWPSLVDVPTGLGKTSMLDIAVFLLAMSAGGEAPTSLGRRRIYMVVDRRIVVDQAEQHGQLIADALDNAEPGTICQEVAERLRSLSSARAGDPVLRVVKMRGGVTWDAAWLPRPDLPAIVTGTVDQVGSRLFFRGYGVSARRRPIDAALVGTDSVIMIDEAHLAQAFTAALASASKLDHSEVLGLPSTSIIHLSATAAEQSNGWSVPFDEEAHLRSPTAGRRLQATKTLSFVDSSEKRIVREMVGRAVELTDRPGARVLVVCNTVNRAREVYDALGSKKSSCAAETMLLMGRSRPLDRERIAERVTELFEAEREQTPAPAVLVATQTIEVGIDLDATDMVTETAAWDALVQRFGRVNRRGDFPEATVTVIEDNAKKPPVYGQTKSMTAEFLRESVSDGLDVSPLALRHLGVPGGLTAEPPLLPVLLPAQLDAWARTNPVPSNDPPLDPYLHGIKRTTAQITVVWRDGLVDALGELIPANEAGVAVDSLPVRSEECVELSLRAVREWLLNGKKPSIMADVDEFDDIPFSEEESDALVLRRAADAAWQWVSSASLRPGDLIVVPSCYGGLDRFGWNPANRESVSDVAELASLRRGRAVLRLDAGLGGRLGLEPPPMLTESRAAWSNSEDPAERDAAAQHLVETVREWVRSGAVPADGSPWTADDIADLGKAFSREGARVSGSDDRAADPVPLLHASSSTMGWRGVDEGMPADSSSLSRRVSLADHLRAVGARSEQIADDLGLPPELRRVIVDAARWHDLGKADPRFQAMLFGGSEIAAELAEAPLAKSGMSPGDRAQRLRALRLSGLPKGARHEAWSEAIVAAHLDGLEKPYPGDEDLLLHLVASHHGHARPLLPPVDDRGTHSLDADIDDIRVHDVALPKGVRLADADRFTELNARYGRWGLALLEVIVRCADMTVSSEGS